MAYKNDSVQWHFEANDSAESAAKRTLAADSSNGVILSGVSALTLTVAGVGGWQIISEARDSHFAVQAHLANCPVQTLGTDLRLL